MLCGTRSVRPGRSWPGRRWDDLRRAGLKLIFLVVSRVMSLLRLSRRELWRQDAGILMLRRQLAVAGRERPEARARLAWPDRAWRALLAGTVPAGSRVREVFRAAGTRIVRSAIQAPRMNPVMERWTGSRRRELPGRALVWSRRHLMTVLRQYEDFCSTHRPHRALKQAAPLRRLPATSPALTGSGSSDVTAPAV